MTESTEKHSSSDSRAAERDIIYLGNFFPPKVLSTVVTDQPGKVGFSNHNFESSLIDGITSAARLHPEWKFRILCAPLLYSFPYHNRRFWTSSENYSIEGIPVHSISICNLAVLNKMWVATAVFRSLCAHSLRRLGRRIKGKRNPAPELILNIPTSYIELPVLVWKRLFARKARTTLIIPDIPQMVEAINHRPTHTLRGRLVGAMNAAAMNLASRFDRYVFLTEAMKEFFPGKRNYIVMEGVAAGIPRSGVAANPDKRNEGNGTPRHSAGADGNAGKRSLLYSGTLASAFGILNLLEAFSRVDLPGVELRICGSGETEPLIRESAAKNPAVRFYGLVDSETAKRLQREATVLINPRTSAGEYTRFSFPSKILEYMQAGKPVIMHPLPGIPEEYNRIACLPAAETPEALAREIERVFSLPQAELDELGRKGKELAARKTPAIQVGRILEME